jgi:hypothetical protein
MSSPVDRYDVTSDTWTAIEEMPEARWSSIAVIVGPTGTPAAKECDSFDLLIAKASVP